MKTPKQWGRENTVLASLIVSAIITLVVVASCMWGPYAFAFTVGFAICWALVHSTMFDL